MIKNGTEIKNPAIPPANTVPIKTVTISAKNPPIIPVRIKVTEHVRHPIRHCEILKTTFSKKYLNEYFIDKLTASNPDLSEKRTR